MKRYWQKNQHKTYEDLIVTTSWDDGQKTDIKLAKLLTKYDVKGTFYITKSYRDPLEKQDIIDLDIEHEIGAHTLNHVDLLNIPISEAKREIEGSKTYVEELIGHDIKMFCFPWGQYNEGIKKIVKDAGFIAARTCKPGDFDVPEDPYEWHITLHASNASPSLTFRIWRMNSISTKSLIDWEVRAKLLFNLALERGGIYHLWGHSYEIDEKTEWDKLERVLKYISNRLKVKYLTNGETLGGLKCEASMVCKNI
jgi:peptidoglycan/xylan/chitin deacetylase (PgdA/CDA1 family)